MKLASFLVWSALAAALSGCLYIPTPQHSLLSGRGMIDEETTRGFRAGTTTRGEVLLLLGEPDATFKNQSVFLYTWTRTQGYLVVGGYGKGEIVAVGKTTVLLLEFGEHNYLKRHEYLSPGFFSSPVSKATEWLSEGPMPAGLSEEKR